MENKLVDAMIEIDARPLDNVGPECPNCGKPATFTSHYASHRERHGLDAGPFEHWDEEWLTCDRCGARTDDAEIARCQAVEVAPVANAGALNYTITPTPSLSLMCQRAGRFRRATATTPAYCEPTVITMPWDTGAYALITDDDVPF